MDPKNEEKIKHIYDDIVENDNPMPRWWLTTFFLCVAFALVYFVLFFGWGKLTIEEEYLTKWNRHQSERLAAEKLAAEKARAGIPVAKRIEMFAGDAAAVAEGRVIFTERCAMCHGTEGQGLVGPNLADDFWIHGDGGPDGIYKTVAEGVDGKGMPAWKAVLSTDDVLRVAAFVKTLRGTKPPNPKAPQGTEHKL